MNPARIETPTVLVVSGGRTGTKFFGDRLARMLPECHSVHEPDVIAGFEYPIGERLRTFGLYHMVIGRLLGRTGIRNLSLQYLSGRLDHGAAVQAIVRHRARYYASLGKPVVLEAYTGWFGLLPVLPDAFARVKVVVVYRDPRDWVRSIMNWGTFYGPRDWVGRLGLGRLLPGTIGDREAAARWPRMSRFERVCWAWTAINRTLREGAARLPSSLCCRYEALFLEQDRELQQRLLEYVSDFGDRRFPYHYEPGEFRQRVHGSSGGFPPWQQWSPQQAALLQRHCGELMELLGYGGEPRWRELLAQGGASGD